MPNWCGNQLRIEGDKRTLLRLIERIDGETVFDFDKVIPYPKWCIQLDEQEEILPDCMSHRKYEWSVYHWGTKWNSCDASRSSIDKIEKGKWAVEYDFQTAWSPPAPVIKKLADLYPSLSFELLFEEEGMDFSGKLSICKAKGLYQEEIGEYGEFHLGEDDFWDGNIVDGNIILTIP